MAKKNSYMRMNDGFLKKTFNRFLIPSMLSVLGGTINVLLDNLMIGVKLGHNGLASLSLCMPLYLIMCTIGSMVASGGSVLSAQALGKNDHEASEKVYAMCVNLLSVLGAVFTIVSLIFMGNIAGLLCGSADIYDDVYGYAGILVIGAIPKILMYVPFFFLPIEGKNKYCSVLMLGMTGCNALLNYIFIFLLNLGTRGAALASVIASLLCCIVGFVILEGSENFRVKLYKPDRKLIFEMLKIGTPHALDNFCASLKLLIVNGVLLSLGGSVAVSVYAVVNSLSEFALCITNGVPQTASPITAIYYSESNNKGLRLLLRRQFATGLSLSVLYGAAVVIFSHSIARVFGLSDVSVIPFVCLALYLVPSQINSIMIYFFGRSRHVLLADVITVLHLVVFVYVGLLIFRSSYVWAFLPFAEVMTLVVWLLIAFIISRRSARLSPVLLLDNSIDTMGSVIDFSVKSSKEEICQASSRISDFCGDNEMSVKQTMRISLAIEEILVLMSEKSLDGSENGSFDVRVYSVQGKTGIRIRCMGKPFNPLEQMKKDADSEENLGIKMINEMASSIVYNNAFGANCLLITFGS